mgnify:CR=1 FL=1
MKQAYVFKFSSPETGYESITLYDSLQGCINRLSALNHMNRVGQYDEITISFEEIISEKLSAKRLTNAQKN